MMPIRRTLLLALTVAVLIASPTTGWAVLPAVVEETMQSDAELTDVTFASPELGWAVGDRGVIWHTRDGGQHWQRQKSDCRCRLESVSFIDPQRGWAAGGYTQPYTHTSHAVILRTEDGGRTWTELRNITLPALTRVKFFDARQGIAIGRASAMFPSGVFTTDDGGATWTTVPSTDAQSWLAGDFLDPHTGAVAGGRGEVRAVRRRAIERARMETMGLRSLNSMRLIAPRFGWVVGDGGLVLATGDLGQTWQSPASELPPLTQHFDFSAIALHGPHVWVAGSPGTRVFHSPNGGQTWSAHSTGQSLPIEGLYFVDASRGVAVGSLGTILATDNAGRTWRRVQAGGERAALVGVYSEPRRVPWELLAHASAAEGYLSTICLLTRRDLDTPAAASADLARRAHEALLEVGGCRTEHAWRFPLRQPGLELSLEQMMSTLNRANDRQALEQLESRVVRLLRTWRPEVVVTHHAAPQNDDPLSYLVGQIVLRAVEAASDPTRHVDLTTEVGLAPWRVKKVYGTLPDGRRGSTELNTAGLEPRLGASLADAAMEARGMVERNYSPPPVELGMQLLIDRTPGGRGDRELFTSIAVSPGSDARRRLTEPNSDMLDTLQRMAQKRRNMQQVIERSTDASTGSIALLGNVGDLTAGLEPAGASLLLYQLAGQMVARGQWPLAADTYRALIDRHPNHPLAHSAQIWLLQYYASGEAAWRMRRQSGAQKGTVLPTIALDPANRAQPSGGPVALERRGTQRVMHAPGGTDAIFEQAAKLGEALERSQPELYARPELRFSLASAHRKLGYANQASRYFLSLRRSRPEDAWLAAAQGERWLAERTGVSPKSIAVASQAEQRPHLDGRLDDACWKNAAKITLTSIQDDDRGWPAWAKLAYDDKFLYFAAHCQKADTADYPTTSQTRTRDPELGQHDRVDLLLDLDRDYATYYQLTVDHRGFAAENCWGDKTWNPQWYVAIGGDQQHWTVEAAIPLGELTGNTPTSGHVWAAGVQRVCPRAGFQSWTQPARVDVAAEGLGFLMFQ